MAKLLNYTTWPHIDEDQIIVHAKAWIDAGTGFSNFVNYSSTNTADTVFDSQAPWVRGHDKPLDAFMEFWKNNPEANYNSAAAQAPLAAAALANISGFISTHKITAISILYDTQDFLGQRYHMFGYSENGLFAAFGAHDHETMATESAGHLHKDQATITKATNSLQKLTEKTRQQLEQQVQILDKITTIFDGISASVTKTSSQLFYPQDSPSDPAATRQWDSMPTNYDAWLKAGSHQSLAAEQEEEFYNMF